MSEPTTFFRRLGKALDKTGFSLLVLLGLPLLADAATATRPEQLIDATRSFLEEQVADYLQRSQIQARHEVEINRLDPRLRLALCDLPLNARLESPTEPIGRTTVRVSCEGSSPWSVFVPAQVRLYREVIVASRPLKREAVLSPADVKLAERDVGLLNQGYLTSVNQIMGKKLTRSAMPDQVLAPSHVALAEAIRKGDQVVITAQNATINVRMPGEAMNDGALGEQIRVKNLRSGRIVRARVVGPGHVEVLM